MGGKRKDPRERGEKTQADFMGWEGKHCRGGERDYMKESEVKYSCIRERREEY